MPSLSGPGRGKGREALSGDRRRSRQSRVPEVEGSFSRPYQSFSGGLRDRQGQGSQRFGWTLGLPPSPKENPEVSLFHACSFLLLPIPSNRDLVPPTWKYCRMILRITAPRLRSSSAAIRSIFERISFSIRIEQTSFFNSSPSIRWTSCSM